MEDKNCYYSRNKYILYGNPIERNGRIICKVYKEIDIIWILHFLNKKHE